MIDNEYHDAFVNNVLVSLTEHYNGGPSAAWNFEYDLQLRLDSAFGRNFSWSPAGNLLNLDSKSLTYHSLTDQSVKFYPFPQYEVTESSSVAAASMEGPTQATASDAEVEALIPPPIPDFLLNTPRPTDEELNATLDVDIGDPPGLQCPFDPLALCDPLLPDASPELADPDPSLAPAPTDLNAPAVEVEETTTLTDSLSGDTTYLPLVNGGGGVDAASAEAASQSPTVTKYYFVGGQRVFLKEGGVPRYIHADHLGSTAIETNLTGDVSAERRYLAFGGERASSGTLRTENQFTSQKLDETGLYYYGARYYDPELGQFVSPDTIVPAPGEVFAYNRYMYAYGNPLKFVDPSGHIAVCFRGGFKEQGSSSSSGGDADFWTACEDTLEKSGYDENVHGDILRLKNRQIDILRAVSAILEQEQEYSSRPVVIVGHSWGGAAALKTAQLLDPSPLSLPPDVAAATSAQVDLLFLIDAELGARAMDSEVPDNIDTAVNVYAQTVSDDRWWNLQNGVDNFDGMQNIAAPRWVNIYGGRLGWRRIGHNNISTIRVDAENLKVNPFTYGLLADKTAQTLLSNRPGLQP